MTGYPGKIGRSRTEREFFIDNLLVRIHYIIVMIRWTGLAPWEFESPFPGSLTSTFLAKPNTWCARGVERGNWQGKHIDRGNRLIGETLRS